MSHSSEIAEHIKCRRRMAAYTAEIVARSRDVLASSEALLAKNTPTTFLGERHYPPDYQPMPDPDKQNEAQAPQPSGEALRVIGEYAADLREILEKLRRKMN